MHNKNELFKSLSIVIPTYNAADWLPETITYITKSLSAAGYRKSNAEIVIVNDGSTDDTISVVDNIRTDFNIRLINQQNGGRFLARKAGIAATNFKTILLIDSRVHIYENSIKFAKDYHYKHPELKLWNAHVDVAKKGNVFARFGEAIVFIGWRKYFSKPQLVSYSLKDFDLYPKGTTCFIAPKAVLQEAIGWFESVTTDMKYSSDDTLLLRHMNERCKITIAPQFACLYHSRSKLSQFLKHSYHRGKVFVDGFLRPGTRFYYPLMCIYVASIVIPLIIALKPVLFIPVLFAALLLWFTELIVALLLQTPFKDALSLFILTPIFTIVYGAGLWWALVHRLTQPTSNRS